MKTIEIEWTETSSHKVTVNVPDDFDLTSRDYDIANDLATLDDDGFIGATREDITIRSVAYDATVEEFEPEEIA